MSSRLWGDAVVESRQIDRVKVSIAYMSSSCYSGCGWTLADYVTHGVEDTFLLVFSGLVGGTQVFLLSMCGGGWDVEEIVIVSYLGSVHPSSAGSLEMIRKFDRGHRSLHVIRCYATHSSAHGIRGGAWGGIGVVLWRIVAWLDELLTCQGVVEWSGFCWSRGVNEDQATRTDLRSGVVVHDACLGSGEWRGARAVGWWIGCCERVWQFRVGSVTDRRSYTFLTCWSESCCSPLTEQQLCKTKDRSLSTERFMAKGDKYSLQGRRAIGAERTMYGGAVDALQSRR
ncbi:hypothetical protein Tco_0260556 [Tanacetum coccineum]